MASDGSPAEFLRVPLFPGAQPVRLLRHGGAGVPVGPGELDALVMKLRGAKVGGRYWGAQPALPSGCRLIRVRDPDERARQVAALPDGGPIVEWLEPDWPRSPSGLASNVVGPCDPWHMLGSAEEFVGEVDDDADLVALVLGIKATWVGGPEDPAAELRSRLAEVAAAAYSNPFTGEQIDFTAAMELCAIWRRLIDSNRDIQALLGFASWKRSTVTPLLWDGGRGARFVAKPADPVGTAAVWRSKVQPGSLNALEKSGAKLVEVEDGFIRSAGLGADCVPPLSIVVDRLGIYFDPGKPSDLEQLLQTGDFRADLVGRARRLREQIVATGITKYGAGEQQFRPPFSDKPSLLVVGQVEDDRAVTAGMGPATNLELLRRVRSDNPGAFLLYKPHPDVEAGHRRGAVGDDTILTVADQIVRDLPISSLISAVDEVHVNTSLAGFEALMRGRPVTTYGVPFYAGWGLTTDRGPVPDRRTARRTLDELVAAALLLYPRYLDPVTGLPCPAEVLVSRLSSPDPARPSAVVQLRRLQGRLNRVVASFRSHA